MTDAVMTKQRQVILDLLRASTAHPTADELYLQVREILPNISLGTVYRNLNWLAQRGVILSIETGSQKRFDGQVEPHYHFRCKYCGQIYDLDAKSVRLLESQLLELDGHIIEAVVLEFSGCCKVCQKRR